MRRRRRSSNKSVPSWLALNSLRWAAAITESLCSRRRTRHTKSSYLTQSQPSRGQNQGRTPIVREEQCQDKNTGESSLTRGHFRLYLGKPHLTGSQVSSITTRLLEVDTLRKSSLSMARNCRGSTTIWANSAKSSTLMTLILRYLIKGQWAPCYSTTRQCTHNLL